MLTDTAFDVVSVVSVDVSEVLVKVTVGAVDEQARRNMLGVGTQLEVVATRRLCHVDSGTSRSCAREIRNVAEGTGDRHLEVMNFTSIACGDIPEVVFTPRCRHRETTERRRVVANRVRRQAVAVTPDATTGTAPLKAERFPVFELRTKKLLTSNDTQLAGTSEPEPSTRMAVLSEACDCLPTDTLPSWSLLMNQNDCSVPTPLLLYPSTGPTGRQRRTGSVVKLSEPMASRCRT